MSKTLLSGLQISQTVYTFDENTTESQCVVCQVWCTTRTSFTSVSFQQKACDTSLLVVPYCSCTYIFNPITVQLTMFYFTVSLGAGEVPLKIKKRCSLLTMKVQKCIDGSLSWLRQNMSRCHLGVWNLYSHYQYNRWCTIWFAGSSYAKNKCHFIQRGDIHHLPVRRDMGWHSKELKMLVMGVIKWPNIP